MSLNPPSMKQCSEFKLVKAWNKVTSVGSCCVGGDLRSSLSRVMKARGKLREPDRGKCGCELREDGTLFSTGGRDGMERERQTTDPEEWGRGTGRGTHLREGKALVCFVFFKL